MPRSYHFEMSFAQFLGEAQIFFSFAFRTNFSSSVPSLLTGSRWRSRRWRSKPRRRSLPWRSSLLKPSEASTVCRSRTLTMMQQALQYYHELFSKTKFLWHCCVDRKLEGMSGKMFSLWAVNRFWLTIFRGEAIELFQETIDEVASSLLCNS